MIAWYDVGLRLGAALLFCGGVGMQRFLVGKAAGVRTHILVGLGAALFTIVSGYAFHTTAANADRIAAQVVSGIGFIAGGAILKEGASIKGLTTAAGLWTAAALGMAAGAGLFVVGAAGTVVILLTLAGLRQVEVYLPRRVQNTWVVEATLSPGTSVDSVRDVLAQSSRALTLLGMDSDGEVRVVFEVDMTPQPNVSDVIRRLHEAGAHTVHCHAEDRGIELGP